MKLDKKWRAKNDLGVASGGVSPVLEVALLQLRAAADMAKKKNDGRPGEFRAVVFVQTQLAALALAAHLTGLGEDWLRPGLLLGQGGDAGMTMARQREALRRFREGEVNVLLATSIAEEGLDIQQCGLVVRTEPPRTIIQNIQGRGRARLLDATYAVVVLEDMLVQKTNKRGNVVSEWSEADYVAGLSEGEDDAWEALQRCIAGAGSRVADTSWSHFDQGQVAAALGLRQRGGGDLVLGGAAGVDWKSRLNIFLQKRDRPDGCRVFDVCSYDSTRTGPPHQPLFLATVTVGGVVFEGEERPAKKASEHTAAYAALGSLSLDARSLQVDPAAAPAWAFSRDSSVMMSESDDSDDAEFSDESDGGEGASGSLSRVSLDDY